MKTRLAVVEMEDVFHQENHLKWQRKRFQKLFYVSPSLKMNRQKYRVPRKPAPAVGQTFLSVRSNKELRTPSKTQPVVRSTLTGAQHKSLSSHYS